MPVVTGFTRRLTAHSGTMVGGLSGMADCVTAFTGMRQFSGAPAEVASGDSPNLLESQRGKGEAQHQIFQRVDHEGKPWVWQSAQSLEGDTSDG